MRLYAALVCYAAGAFSLKINQHVLHSSRTQFRSRQHATSLPSNNDQSSGGSDRGLSVEGEDGPEATRDRARAKIDKALPGFKADDGSGSSTGSSVSARAAEAEETDEDNNMILNIVSAPLLAQGTAVVAEALVNTEAAYSVLTPLHKWTLSKRRVAMAVQDQERARTADKAKLSAAVVRSKFLENISMPALGTALATPQQTLNDALAALKATAEVPGKLVASVRRTTQDLAETPDRVKNFAEDVAESTRNVVETLASVPETAADFGRKTERALEGGAEAYNSLRALPGESQKLVDGAALKLSKASKGLEELPRTLPTLLETAADKTRVLADDVAAGTAALVEWSTDSVVNVGGSFAEGVVRKVLLPIHAQRLSTLRVSIAVKAEQAALMPPPIPSSTEVKSKAILTEGALELTETPETGAPAVGAKVSGEATSEENVGTITGIRQGLRSKFSAWRRNRRPLTSPVDEMVSPSSTGVESSATAQKMEPVEALAPLEFAQGDEVDYFKDLPAAAAAAALKAVTDGTKTELSVLNVDKLGTITNMPSKREERKYDISPAPAPAAVRKNASASGASLLSAVSTTVPDIDAKSDTLAPARVAYLDTLGPRQGAVATKRAKMESAGGIGEAADARERRRQKATFDDVPTILRSADTPVGSEASSGPTGVRVRTAEVSHRGSAESNVPGAISEPSLLVASGSLDPPSGGVGGGSAPSADAPSPSLGETVSAEAVAQVSSVIGTVDDAAVAAVAETVGTEIGSTRFSDSQSTAAESSSVTASEQPTKVISVHSDAAAAAAAAAAAVVSPIAHELSAAVSVDTDSGSSTTVAEAGSTAARAAVTATQGAMDRSVDTSLPPPPPPSTDDIGGVPSLEIMLDETVSGLATAAGEANVEEEEDVSDQLRRSSDATVIGEPQQLPVAAATLGKQERSTMAPTSSLEPEANGGRAEERMGWGAAAEFLKNWMASAVPEKKAQLRESQNTVCWERQWYPIALVDDLLRRWPDGETTVQFEMLGRVCQLLPRHTGAATAAKSDGELDSEKRWRCKEVPNDDEHVEGGPPNMEVEVPLRDASGLLWAWADTSPEGLAAAELAHPPSLDAGSSRRTQVTPAAAAASSMVNNTSHQHEEAGNGPAPLPWRRLWRSRPGVGQAEGGTENPRGGRPLPPNFVECELACNYMEAVRGLMTPSHAAAVRAAAAGNIEAAAAAGSKRETLADVTVTAANSSGLNAIIDAPTVQGDLFFAVPTLVEWHLSPPRVDRGATPAAAASITANSDEEPPNELHRGAEGKATDENAVAPRWLRWFGLGRSGGGGEGDNMSRECDDKRRGVRRAKWKGGIEVGAVRYVAVLLPVGPARTKVFARLEEEKRIIGLFAGASFLWSRRIRGALLAKAICAAVERRESARDAFNASEVEEASIPTSVGDWLAGAIKGGPAF